MGLLSDGWVPWDNTRLLALKISSLLSLIQPRLTVLMKMESSSPSSPLRRVTALYLEASKFIRRFFMI
ncbi:MAG: hypothetical protein FH762_03340 [Firmicutes bacterium]|nr:hypothetical protein [Bacillota bacterium]